jgi:ribonuclease HII
VYAAAVILPRGLNIEGLNDSKKLTEKKREALFDPIREQAVAYGIAFATVEEIEELNILNATFLAMNRAIEQLSPAPELALIDGNRNTGIRFPSRCVVKGDAKCADIAAASVLAKVSRDRYMLQMAEKYPEYHFEQHKGYGTKLHYDALREHGPSPIHRMSFLKKLYG